MLNKDKNFDVLEGLLDVTIYFANYFAKAFSDNGFCHLQTLKENPLSEIYYSKLSGNKILVVSLLPPYEKVFTDKYQKLKKDYFYKDNFLYSLSITPYPDTGYLSIQMTRHIADKMFCINNNMSIESITAMQIYHSTPISRIAEDLFNKMFKELENAT